MSDADADAIESKLVEVASSGISRVRTDAGEVESISVKDLIEAHKYLAAKGSASKKSFGLRFRQAKLPGAVGRNIAD